MTGHLLDQLIDDLFGDFERRTGLSDYDRVFGLPGTISRAVRFALDTKRKRRRGRVALARWRRQKAARLARRITRRHAP